jgi:hypothetical protein
MICSYCWDMGADDVATRALLDTTDRGVEAYAAEEVIGHTGCFAPSLGDLHGLGTAQCFEDTFLLLLLILLLDAMRVSRGGCHVGKKSWIVRFEEDCEGSGE